MAGKDVIYVPGYFEKTNRRSQWDKQREIEEQVRGGDCTNSVEPEVEEVMDSELILPNRVAVTVRGINEQCKKGKERKTDENRVVDSRSGKVTASHDSVSNEGALNVADNVISGEINADSTQTETENRATEINVNSGSLDFDSLINAHLKPNQEVEANQTPLETTLAASAHGTHVTINMENLFPVELTAEAEENPKNIRSWKRIMRQPNPNESIAACGAGKKRKATTDTITTPETSHKRLQLQFGHSPSSTLVEAAQQPRQAQ